MSKILSLMNAAASKGNTVGGFVSATNVDSIVGRDVVENTIRWVYGEYYQRFVGLSEEESMFTVGAMIDSGSLYEDYSERHGVPGPVTMATLNEALRWTARCVSRDIKDGIVLCYLDDPQETLSADEEVNVLKGAEFNSFLPCNDKADVVSVRRVHTDKFVHMRVLNRGLDTIQIALTTGKER